MAYELVTAPSTQQAVMIAVRDFAVANGWTNNNYTAQVDGSAFGVMSLSLGTVFVSFRWGDFGGDATTRSIAMYQALGYSPSNATTPWLNLDDSGSGTTLSGSVSSLSQRRIARIGDGPFVALHLFANPTDSVSGNSAAHIYGVLEYSNGVFRHFGFGNLDKHGDWTGGEWCAGHEWDPNDEGSPTSNLHSVLLDSVNDQTGSNEDELGTVHVEGLPGMGASEKWGVCWRSTSIPSNTDRAGNDRVRLMGGVRGNMYSDAFGTFIPDSLSGHIPMLPCPIWYRRSSRAYLLGFMPNIRMIQLQLFNPGQEFTIGANTWQVFPVTQKSETPLVGVDSSGNMGIAYLKVV